MCAFIVLDLVLSVLCQEIGWEEHLEWDVRLLSQSFWILWTLV